MQPSIGGAVADAELAHRVPGEFPDFLRGTPYAAERFGAFAQAGFVVADAHGDDVIGRSAQAARTRGDHGRASTISSTVL